MAKRYKVTCGRQQMTVTAGSRSAARRRFLQREAVRAGLPASWHDTVYMKDGPVSVKELR